MNNETKRIIIDEVLYTQLDYPFLFKPNFSTLGTIIEISTQGPVMTFVPVSDDKIRNLLGFNKATTYEEYNFSPNPIDILSFDNLFLKGDIAQGVIFKGKRSGMTDNFTMDVDPGYKYIENIRVECNGI